MLTKAEWHETHNKHLRSFHFYSAAPFRGLHFTGAASHQNIAQSKLQIGLEISEQDKKPLQNARPTISWDARRLQTIHLQAFALHLRLSGVSQRRARRHFRSVHNRRTILNVDDAVVCTPSLKQLYVHLALDVHKDEAAREANCNDDKLCPEWPFENA